MLKNTILMTFFILVAGGCASDGNMQSSGGGSSTAGGPPGSSNPAMVGVAAAESSSTSSTMSSAPAMNQPDTSKNRIAAGVEEETLDTCLARIPKDATAGQRMLAEQTCRRDFASRR